MAFDQLTLFAVGSHASPSAWRDSDEEATTSDGSGPSSLDAFAIYDPALSSWRTSQGSLFEEWAMYSASWPSSGTTRNGKASRRPPLVPRTSATESSSSPVSANHQAPFPTPSAAVYGSSGNGTGNNVTSRGRPSLEAMARHNLWPTPTASDWKGPNFSERGTASGNGLATAAGGPLNPTFVEWLMGFPSGWTDCEPSATPSSPRSPNGSDGGS